MLLLGMRCLIYHGLGLRGLGFKGRGDDEDGDDINGLMMVMADYIAGNELFLSFLFWGMSVAVTWIHVSNDIAMVVMWLFVLLGLLQDSLLRHSY